MFFIRKSAKLINLLLPPLIMILGYVLKGLSILAKTLMELPFSIREAFAIGERKKEGITAEKARMIAGQGLAGEIYQVFGTK